MIGDILFYLCAVLVLAFGFAIGRKSPEQRKRDIEKRAI
jgi:hypothetical protein